MSIIKFKAIYCFQFVVLFLILHQPFYCIAQVEYPGIPVGIEDIKTELEYYHLPKAEKHSDVAVKNLRAQHKAAVFGKVSEVVINIMEIGTRVIARNNMQCVYLALVAEGASSVGLNFLPYSLNPGCKLFIYDPSMKNVLGAYTYRNNNDNRNLMVRDVESDTLVIELQIANGITDIGLLELNTACIGFMHDKNRNNKDAYYGVSAVCNVDINCLDDVNIQQQKNAVCRLIIESGNVRLRCSGALLNSVSNEKKPYVLTAGHCIDDEFAAHKTIAFFDYESPYCNGPDGKIKSVSGSYLKAKAELLDFALLELMEQPPVNYYPLYSGWNLSNTPSDHVYCIHHPQGDVKKVAYDSNSVFSETYPGYETEGHWMLEKYEIGSTEEGSSGAPLFNSDNQIIGSLSGGNEVCTEYIYDYYQKFNYSWDRFNREDEQLMNWLDPESTGTMETQNYDPYGGLTSDLANSINNYSLLPYNPWGYVGGHNAGLYNEYSERFNTNGTKYIYAISLDVARAYSGRADIVKSKTGVRASQIIVKIYDGEYSPDESVFEKPFYLTEFTESAVNYLRLDTLVAVDRNFFVGYELKYFLPADTFALNVALTADTNTAFMKAATGTWVKINNGTSDLNGSLGIIVHTADFYPPNSYTINFPEEEITLYPNPSSDYIQVLFKNKPSGKITTRIYDVFGRMVQSDEYAHIERNIRIYTSNIRRSGVYFLYIEYEGTEAMKKFISIH